MPGDPGQGVLFGVSEGGRIRSPAWVLTPARYRIFPCRGAGGNGSLERTLSWITNQRPPGRRSTTQRRGCGQKNPGPGTRCVHPKTGVQVDRCFFLLKKPEKSAGQGHEDKADLCEAAGSLLLVPDLRDLPRNLRAELREHSDYAKNDKAGYMLCGRFEKSGSYLRNPGLLWARIPTAKIPVRAAGRERGTPGPKTGYPGPDF